MAAVTPDSGLNVRSKRLILALTAILVFGACWFIRGDGLIPGTPFRDPDDAMRMVQVIDLVDGAAWYDLNQHRVNPPSGLDMHWSRLPDLPLAAVLLGTKPFLDRDAAVLLAARVVPPLLGVCFFYAFVWAAIPLSGKNGFLYSGLLAIGLWFPLLQFASYRVDHHGWQLLLAMVTNGAVIRVILCQRPLHFALIAGITGTLGLWVGAEAIPWVGLAAAALTLNWVRHGRPGGDALAVFGVTLAASSAMLLPLVVPSARWGLPACDAFSIVTLGIGGAVALCGLGAAAGDRLGTLGGWKVRLGVGIALGSVALAGLYLLFPVCARGPFSQVSPAITFWAENVAESQSLVTTMLRSPGDAAALSVLPAAALAIALTRAALTRDTQRTLWLCLTLMVAGAMGLLLWQMRGAFLAAAYAGLPLAWLAASAGERADLASRRVARLLLAAGIPFAVAALPVVAMSGAQALTTVKQPKTQQLKCDLRPAVAALNQIHTGVESFLIAAPIDLGPSLLFMTPYQVLAAPYHRNTGGLIDIRRLLYCDEASAAEVVRRRGVDVILVCADDPYSELTRKTGPARFFDQLLAGDAPPWLRQLEVDSQVHVFVVDRNRVGTPNKAAR